MSRISPCLWFNGDAEEAAAFYVSLLPDSRIERVQRNITDSISGKVGTVLVVEFTLAGQGFMPRWLLWAYVAVGFIGFAAMLPISAAFIGTSMATFSRLMIFQNWI